jgi:hypothetical protein
LRAHASIALVASGARKVRFAPESDRMADISAGLKSVTKPEVASMSSVAFVTKL